MPHLRPHRPGSQPLKRGNRGCYHRHVKIETHTYHSQIRLRLRQRLAIRYVRWRMRRKFGQEFLDMLDECDRLVTREFLFEREHSDG